MASALTWFEIATTDLDRAANFYSTVLDKPLRREDFGGIPHGIFPYDPATNGIGGALVLDPQRTPSAEGAVIYLHIDSEAALDTALRRVGENGGRVLMPKTHIGDPGFIALILDTEGNRIGLNAIN
ncbi:MAG: VOC family protein [Anaerolineae bacterium]